MEFSLHVCCWLPAETWNSWLSPPCCKSLSLHNIFLSWLAAFDTLTSDNGFIQRLFGIHGDPLKHITICQSIPLVTASEYMATPFPKSRRFQEFLCTIGCTGWQCWIILQYPCT
jgi:hypothetical protein